MNIELTEINGRKLEYLLQGKGEKTVVIMPGMGNNGYEWLDIMSEISKYALVIAIHRPGVGHSELGKGSNTYIAAKDTHLLLQQLKIQSRVTLVGHSYGGLCVQHFARLYPEKVDSIVFVESTSLHIDELNKLELPVSDKIISDEVYMNLWTEYSKATQEELTNEIKPKLSKEERKLPLNIQNELLEINVRPQIYSNQISELIDVNNCRERIEKAGIFPNCPLRILIRDEQYSINELVRDAGMPVAEAEIFERLWQKLSFELKDLSDKAIAKIVKNSNHSMNETRPDAIIDAIKTMLTINE